MSPENENYTRLKALSPELFQSAVQVGSLVGFYSGMDRVMLAARVESAVVSLLLKQAEKIEDLEQEIVEVQERQDL